MRCSCSLHSFPRRQRSTCDERQRRWSHTKTILIFRCMLAIPSPFLKKDFVFIFNSQKKIRSCYFFAPVKETQASSLQPNGSSGNSNWSSCRSPLTGSMPAILLLLILTTLQPTIQPTNQPSNHPSKHHSALSSRGPLFSFPSSRFTIQYLNTTREQYPTSKNIAMHSTASYYFTAPYSVP